MTYTDDTRRYAKPYYEAALALWRYREGATEPRLRRMEPDAMDMVSGTFGRVYGEAHAVLDRMRELGFINDIGLVAIRAEEDEGKGE